MMIELAIAAAVFIGAMLIANRSKGSESTDGSAKESDSKKISLPVLNREKIITVVLIAIGIFFTWLGWGLLRDFFTLSPLDKLAVFGIVIFTLMAIYGVWTIRNDDPVWPKRFLVIGFGGVLITTVLVTAFGTRWFSDPWAKNAFDLKTGKPLYMVYMDRDGKWKRGYSKTGELLRPEDCLPKEEKVDGNSNDKDVKSKEDGTCFSPATGEPMIPISPATAPDSAIDPFGEEDSVVGQECGSAPFMVNQIVGEEENIVSLAADRRYKFLFASGRESDFQIDFADVPLEGQPSFDPGPIKDWLDIGHYGHAGPLSIGLTQGSVRVKTNLRTFQRRVGGKCITFRVYLKRG